MNDILTPAVFTLESLSEEQSVVLDFLITEKDMSQFASLSGDFNPLHVDDAFARAKGFSGVVVYGGLIIAHISRLIGMNLPGRDSLWSSIDVKFRNPLYVNQIATLEAVISAISSATGLIELKISLRSGNKLIAKGKAEVLLVNQ
ncbi:MaoC/PaaZ C-terminal domain-containing protein [Dickeya oryzae]|uniref:MaoC/PaaZ C-terminal domain-containing protein n=1 Tax=Dickeya oryzae TaxID=1240404 RepID=UPI0006AD00A0|nr:MaoC/PaaZ C-terminal domain-containing protein [Dickeya oryzae]